MRGPDPFCRDDALIMAPEDAAAEAEDGTGDSPWLRPPPPAAPGAPSRLLREVDDGRAPPRYDPPRPREPDDAVCEPRRDMDA